MSKEPLMNRWTGRRCGAEMAVALNIRELFQVEKSVSKWRPSTLLGIWFLIALIFQFLKTRQVVRCVPSHSLKDCKVEFLKISCLWNHITPELVGVKSNSLPLGKLSGRHVWWKTAWVGTGIYKKGHQAVVAVQISDKKRDLMPISRPYLPET